MKYTLSRILCVAFCCMLYAIKTYAVAPLPGSGLVEPKRPRAPFEIVFHDSKTNVQRVAPKQSAPQINMAPRGLLMLVEFKDVTFDPLNTQQAFDSLANGENYTYNGATGSCQAYFKAQSNGQYVPEFDVVGPLKLPQSTAYYGANDDYGNDQYVVDLVIDACSAADQIGIDFEQYDNNKDGMVDFVYIIYAGYAESEGGGERPSYIWPHNWDLISALYYGYSNKEDYYANSDTDYKLPSFDGKLVNAYACSNELRMATKKRAGIGTICHEFSHVLGLPDYYLTVTDSETNPNQRLTPGAWSLMGYGNYLNDGNTPPNYSVYDKYFLGWVTPEVLSKTQELTIPADGESYFMLTRNEKHVDAGAYRTDTVYYLENRQQEGWDTYLPGHGMLIWQVIFDEKDWFNNCPNDYVPRYRLISAVSASSPFTEDKQKPEVPFPGSKNITKYAPFSHNGLYNIQESNGLITCEFSTTTIPSSVENLPVTLSGQWYNIFGQPIDPKTYKGIAIQNNKKYLLR